MGSQRWEVVDTVDSGHRWTWLGASPQKDVWSGNNVRRFRQSCIIKETVLASLWWPLDKTVLIWAVLRKLHITSLVSQFFIAKQLIMHMKMFFQKLPKKWNNFFYVPPPFLGSWCHQLHFLRKDWNPVSLPGPKVQPVTPLVAAWMASSCLAFGLPFPNHKSKPIQSFAWIIFNIPAKCITSNLWQNFSFSHFIIQISEFSELPKNKFSPLVQQWHSESLRQKRFYLELDLWGKYSWYIERNTVETFR